MLLAERSAEVTSTSKLFLLSKKKNALIHDLTFFFFFLITAKIAWQTYLAISNTTLPGMVRWKRSSACWH